MAERSVFTTLNQDTATVSSKEEIVQQVTGDTEGNGTSGSGRPAETGLFNWR